MSTSFDMTNSQPENASHLHKKENGILFLLRILKNTFLQYDQISIQLPNHSGRKYAWLQSHNWKSRK